MKDFEIRNRKELLSLYKETKSFNVMSPHNIIREKLAKAYSKVSSTLHMEKCYSGSFHRPKSLELHVICVKDH